MKEYKTEIKRKEKLTHDTDKYIIRKPEGYHFEPGQATIITIIKNEEKIRRPFTIASTNEDKELEFIIKTYDREGITSAIKEKKVGEEIIIGEPFGNINYKGKGLFIAAGTGIAPFISIIKSQGKKEENKIIYTNKKEEDIIQKEELKNLTKRKKENLLLVLTREEKEGYYKGRISKELLKKEIKDKKQNFYICGPREFVKEIEEKLKDLGIEKEKIIKE